MQNTGQPVPCRAWQRARGGAIGVPVSLWIPPEFQAASIEKMDSRRSFRF